MKKTIITILLALNILALPLRVSAEICEPVDVIDVDLSQSELNDFQGEYKALLSSLKKELGDVAVTGNPDIDYLALVDPINVMIVKLSQVVRKYTDNPEVTKVAVDIEEEYQGQCKEMGILYDELVKKNKSNPNNSQYFKDYKVTVDKLLSDLDKIKLGQNVELNFYTIIDTLDRAMVQLSDTAEEFTENDVTKKIAKSLKEIGSKQIERLDKLIKALIKD